MTWPILALALSLAWSVEGYRVDTGTTREIDEWGVCQRVANVTGKSLFVPTNSALEWTEFRANLPVGVTISTCSCPDIALRAASTNSDTGSSLVIAKPTGLAVDDVMVAHVAQRGGSSGTVLDTPTGWTKLASDELMGSGGGSNSQRSAFYYKVATAGDVAATDFTWSFSGATNSIGGIQAYNNADPLGPIDDSSTMSDTANIGTIDGTAVTTKYTGDMIVVMYAENGNLTFTPPGTFTERYDLANGTQISAMGADELQSAAGSTGTLTATLSGNDNRRTAKIVALRKDTLNCP
ncbi:MAG: hypothetical protein AB7F86_04025 [Bdellovibrionales bacterium]